jgi:hypothetical protein
VTDPERKRMKKARLIWLSATLLLAAYAAAGLVASYSNAVQIRLEPGFQVEVTLLRLAEDRLRADLAFQGDHRQRPELGDSATDAESHRTGRLKFAQPGSSIWMTASAPNAESVSYEAMPKSGWGANTVYRNLTSNLSIEPGVWRSPVPDEIRGLVLHPGFTTVKIQVVSVDSPLVGEVAQLSVLPPLTFKSCMSSVCWLWGWNLWPLIIIAQTIWAAVIGAVAWTKSRRNERREATS